MKEISRKLEKKKKVAEGFGESSNKRDQENEYYWA